MAITFSIADSQEQAVHDIAESAIQDTVVIIRGPLLATGPDQAAVANRLVAFLRTADEDDRITWEDAEWQ